MIGQESTLTWPLRVWLERAGYSVQWLPSEQALLATFPHTPFVACLIDIADGRSDHAYSIALKTLRKCKTFLLPVKLLVSPDMRERWEASPWLTPDDYIEKPSPVACAVDSVQSAIHQMQRANALRPAQWGSLALYYQQRRFYLEGQPVHLTPAQAGLALYLFTHMQTVISRDQLLQEVWVESPSLNTRKVDAQVCAIRRKLALHEKNGWSLETVYGKGYRLEWIQQKGLV